MGGFGHDDQGRGGTTTRVNWWRLESHAHVHHMPNRACTYLNHLHHVLGLEQIDSHEQISVGNSGSTSSRKEVVDVFLLQRTACVRKQNEVPPWRQYNGSPTKVTD
jgi:hypothetical protein